MGEAGLRDRLRHDTADLHLRLDQRVGSLRAAGDYARYLTGSYAFRAAIEPVLAGGAGSAGAHWAPLHLAAALRLDLEVLGLKIPPVPHVAPITNLSARAGALYVLEGSTLGAVLIGRQAADLGFDASSGAAHLALQTSERGRWRGFMSWLEGAGCDATAACAAARRVFDVALAAYCPSAMELAPARSWGAVK